MSERILIVDDDPVCLTAYKSILMEHFIVDGAIGPHAGLDLVRANPGYAVVISDMHMPEMDGIEFLAEVGKLCPKTVKIMLTGYASLETAMAAVNSSHVFGFYSKSCDADDLILAIRKAIAKHLKGNAPNEPEPCRHNILSAEEIAFLTTSP